MFAIKKIVFREPEPPAVQERTVHWAGGALVYRLERSRRRTIGLQVRADGLRVRAPLRSTLAQIDAVVLEKAEWAARHLARLQALAALRPEPQPWAEGRRLPFQGQELGLQLRPGPERAGVAQVVHDGADGPVLRLTLPADAPAAVIESRVRSWLRRQALDTFQARLDHFAPMLGVRWTRLSLTRARTRWGSARADGHIRLHERLIQLAPELLDYVVVHELAHLRVMNHSPAFWAVVASVMPDHLQRRAALRALGPGEL